MNQPTAPVLLESAASGDLDALHDAISDAIAALVAWDLTAFQSAVERQRALCGVLARDSAWRQSPAAAASARRVRELNRIYESLLRHSMQWARTLRSIFEATGNPLPERASVHFRG
jgi:hypothetical protein